MSTVTRHEMPNGDVVFYDDSKHSYWREHDADRGKCSGRLTGASTVSKVFDLDAFGPGAGWGAKMTREGVSILAADGLAEPDSLAWLASPDGIYDRLRDARLRHTDKRDDAADRGTNVHDVVLASLATTGAAPDLPSLTEDEAGYARGLLGWWLDREPVGERSELVVTDLENGTAGRLDLICTIDGRRFLVDLKTGKQLRTSAHVQARGYEWMYTVSGGEPVDDVLLVLARADGSWLECECAASERDWLDAVQVYRSAAGIRRRQGAVERAAA